MFRMVAKISASSDVLEIERSSMMGPVTSVSSVSGALTKEIPVRSTEPAAFDGADELTPACDGGLAEYVELPLSRGEVVVSSPSGSPLLFCSFAFTLRYIFVHRVRASGHSFSKRNLYVL